MKFKLGQKAKDKITGFEGVITGIHKWITGCDQLTLTPLARDNKVEAALTFDEGRIEVVKGAIKPKTVSAKKKGCDQVAPVK